MKVEGARASVRQLGRTSRTNAMGLWPARLAEKKEACEKDTDTRARECLKKEGVLAMQHRLCQSPLDVVGVNGCARVRAKSNESLARRSVRKTVSYAFKTSMAATGYALPNQQMPSVHAHCKGQARRRDALDFGCSKVRHMPRADVPSRWAIFKKSF